MKKTVFPFLLLLLLSGCAKIVTPSGGPRDTTPPKVLKANPENQSLDFTSKIIKLTFDEYVVLNNPVENVFFSPPLDEHPDYSTSGKSVLIKLKTPLLPERTYNIAFANAIKDLTEGNALPLYQYSFSTGSYIDSFMIEGKLINVETTKAEENILILLYQEDIDSLPLTSKPDYITKSQKDGSFLFKHIAPGNYKIFALKDVNSNLIYDLPNELLAFSDSVITARVIAKKEQRDTLASVDSLELSRPILPVLSLFQEEDTVQRLLKTMNPRNSVYRIPYKRPFKDFQAQQIQPSLALPYLEVINSTKDTVSWYFREPITDSVLFIVTVNDFLKDTIALLPYKGSMQRSGRGRRSNVPKLEVTPRNAGEAFNPFMLQFPVPVFPVDSFAATIIQSNRNQHDTIIKYYSVPETPSLFLPLNFRTKEKLSYTVMIRDSIFYGYDGTTNDSITIKFTAKSVKDYGDFSMNYVIQDAKIQYIIILLDSRDNVVQTDLLTQSRQIKYRHLTPGDYKIKVIEDWNGNGKWDTGNYRRKTQPERIFYFEKPIHIRGFWELEEDFILDKPKIDSKH